MLCDPALVPGVRAVLRSSTGSLGVRATTADVWVTCNIFDPWTSGDARFDDFSVTTLPEPLWVSRHWAVSLIIVLLAVAAASTLAVWLVRRRSG